ncbi:MAG: hypothetical protein S4CHLAM2_12170 [Chlamydiales bacterium]|nr:hypothetical protein [Chlamydiales bacterium]
MSMLDRVALVVAERHGEHICATVSVDALHFLSPAYVGEILIFKASINRAWTSSMEVGIRVVAENFSTREHRHIVSAYFTFVALDAHNRPTQVPPVIPETEAEKHRYEEADLRRRNRIRHAQERKERRESGE